MYDTLIKKTIEAELKKIPHYRYGQISLGDIATDLAPAIEELLIMAYNDGLMARD